MTNQDIIKALDRHIRQRPGLSFANYGSLGPYRAELRSIIKDRRQALALLAAVAADPRITADDLVRAARDNYAGRLSILADDKQGAIVDYCTGQYWPTEYRAAACSVLSGALWECWRDHDAQPAEAMRRRAGNMFGRDVARRWFT